jgi:iron complex outermembrane recepter protein
VPGCGAYTDNAGAARSEGAEVQANFQLTRAFRIDVGGSAVRAELTEDALGFVPPAFEGDRLPGSPKINANLGLQYEFDIAGHNAFVRADSIYVGPFYGNLQQSANLRAGDYVKVDATARIVINSLNLDLFVRNLTDADDFTFRDTDRLAGASYGYRLRPRTFGLQLGYAF